MITVRENTDVRIFPGILQTIPATYASRIPKAGRWTISQGQNGLP